MKSRSRLLDLGLLLVLIAVGATWRFSRPQVNPLVGTWETDDRDYVIAFRADGTLDCWKNHEILPSPGKYRVDFSRQPAELDVSEVSAGRTFLLICEFSRDGSLRVQDNGAGDGRPTRFNERAIVLRRMDQPNP